MINIILALMSATSNSTLLQAITEAGLTSNLKLCLDAADSSSYSGSGQNWLDVSGNGHDFLLGESSSSESSDPTFNGTAGLVIGGTHWSFDGGDYFAYDSSNETWMNSLHKDGASFSVIAAVYVPDVGSVCALCGTQTSASGVGFGIEIRSDETPALQVGNGSSSTTFIGDTALTTGAWNVVGMSIAESGGNASFMYLNGAYNQVSGSNTFDAAYSSPSSSSASATLAIGARSVLGGNPLPSGSRIISFGMWQGTALSKANFDTLYGFLRPRLG